jgi:hypothetical protein
MDGHKHEGSVVSYNSVSSDAGTMSTGENSEDLIQAVVFYQEGKNCLRCMHPDVC